MSYADRVMAEMRLDCVYRACDLSAMTGIQVREVSRVLKMLERAGLVEGIKGDGYRRKRLYKTRQRELFRQMEAR